MLYREEGLNALEASVSFPPLWNRTAHPVLLQLRELAGPDEVYL
jgi:hypothetical protein